VPSRNSWVDEDGHLHREGASVFPGEVDFVAIPELAFDYRVTVSIVAEPTPRAVVTEVTIRSREGGPQVTARAVAGELGMVRLAAVRRNTVAHGEATAAEPSWRDIERATGDAVRSAMSDRPRRVHDDDLERAAEVYRRAQASGQPTTRAVKAALGTSAEVARRRVMSARKAGLLPPAETTRPRLT